MMIPRSSPLARPVWKPLCLAIAWLFASFFAAAGAYAQGSTSVKSWQRWEWQLNTTSSYANPYRDIKLRVEFFLEPAAANAAPNFSGYGYWDGGGAFKVRAAFPPPAGGATSATWTWRTTCTGPGSSGGCASDPNLNLPRDSTLRPIVVTASSTLRFPYNHGFLRVQKDAADPNVNRYLVYNDGTRFFWLGDTAWNASVRAVSAPAGGTPQEWENYLSDRNSKGFTVIQMALPVNNMRSSGETFPDGVSKIAADGQPRDENRQTPFVVNSSCSGTIPDNCSIWNPAYWQTFEQKVQAANANGLVVVIVGMGEGVKEAVFPTTADARTYARNVSARLAGNFVIYSPGFDRAPGIDPSTCSTTSNDPSCRMRYTAEEIESGTSPCVRGAGALAPECQLVTNHWAGSLDSAKILSFQGQAWLDFQMFQSGQAKSALPNTEQQLQTLTNRARTLASALYGGSPVKPNVNGEAIYDAGCTAARSTATGNPPLSNYNDYRARQAGYLSMLSGAVGYSYGAFGVFNWGQGMTCPDGSRVASPQAGLALLSASEMSVLGSVFRNTAHLLVSESGRIKNQATTDDKFMVLARDVNGTFLIAYLPDNPLIKIRFASLPGIPRNGHWINPRTAAGLDGSISVSGQQLLTEDPTGLTYSFSRPSCPATGDPGCALEPDWVLMLP